MIRNAPESVTNLAQIPACSMRLPCLLQLRAGASGLLRLNLEEPLNARGQLLSGAWGGKPGRFRNRRPLPRASCYE